MLADGPLYVSGDVPVSSYNINIVYTVFLIDFVL